MKELPNNFPTHINTFIMPDAETNRHLGFKMEITKHVDGSVQCICFK